MTSNKSLREYCESIAETIQDFRKGEITPPTAAHVRRWSDQFPIDKRLAITREMDHLLSQTYFSREAVKAFLESLVDCDGLVDGTPAKFWKRVNFLRLQSKSTSQKDMLGIFGGILKKRFGYWSRDCGVKGGPYLYLDDFIFTGNTIRKDIFGWIKAQSPKAPTVHVAVLASHAYGAYYANKGITDALRPLAGTVSYWEVHQLEDRMSKPAVCDVLRPRMIYRDAAIQNYALGMAYEPALRADQTSSTYYTTESNRRTLESELLRAGLRIRAFCANPSEIMRPLGFSSLSSFGTGAIVATYRNCPNNCPLAWWWGDPKASKHHSLSKWYPLLPRKYNIW